MVDLAMNGGPSTVTIPFDDSWPVIDEEDIAAVATLLRSGTISIGNGSGVIGEFERRVAEYHGVRYALAQNSGTSTLHAAYFALGIGRGDEVIVPTNTWLATATPVLAVGGIPVFCDINPRTLTADPASIERCITPRTKAIAVVHLWGNIAQMDEIIAIAQRHGLAVVEDCSHAHGGMYKGRKVGTIGAIGCFSLQGSKAIVGGEAGVLITDNPEYFDRALVLGHFGRISQASSPEYASYLTGVGHKYRPYPLAIALANAQWPRLPEINRQRKENYEYLMSGLESLPGIEITQTVDGAERGGYYGWRVLYHGEQLGGLPRAVFMDALLAEGVQVDVERYPLLHLERLFREGITFDGGRYAVNGPARTYAPGDLPQAEDVHERLLALPTFTKLNRPLLDQYIAAFRKAAEHADELQAVVA